MSNRWWNYVVRVSGTDKQTQVERASGINQSNLSRWKAGAEPTPKHVRAIAEAFNRPVIEAFVEAGFLTADEIGSAPHLVADLSTVSHDRLVSEIERRLSQLDRLEADSRWLAAVEAAANLTPEQYDRVRAWMGAPSVEEELAKERAGQDRERALFEKLVAGELIDDDEMQEAAQRVATRWPDRAVSVLGSMGPGELATFLTTTLPPYAAALQIADEREAAELGVTRQAFHDVWGGDIKKLRLAVLGTTEVLGEGLPGMSEMTPEEWARERVYDEAHEDTEALAAHEEEHDIEDEQGHSEHP